jgi:integrase
VRLTPRLVAVLREQWLRSGGGGEYLFINVCGGPVDLKNFTSRVWHPLLRQLGIRARKFYCARHTYASLMLGAGENPAWIARQMGHETVEVLFRVYGHLIPDLREADGAAFDRLMANAPVEWAEGRLPMRIRL